MRLLIYTQAVDKNDPILGFFHRWVEEFSKHFESIQVVCLKEGEHHLPANVTVHSLGKESGESRMKYVVAFFRHLWGLHRTYDAVFVHMNPHYVLLGGWYWLLQRTPIYFWRNHAKMNWMTRVAAVFSRRVFYTSPFACTARYAHAVQMPVGIDTERFAPSGKTRTPGEMKQILFLGRVSPVKRVEIFVASGALLAKAYELHVYGDAPKQDEAYLADLTERAGANVRFFGAVKNEEAPSIYRAHDLFVNLTPEGSMDKTVLEAVACGVPVIVANASFRDVLPEEFFISDPTPESLAARVSAVLGMGPEERASRTEAARQKVVEKHSLERLGIMLYTQLT